MKEFNITGNNREKRHFSPEAVEEMVRLHKAGYSNRFIAGKFKIERSTVYWYLKKSGNWPPTEEIKKKKNKKQGLLVRARQSKVLYPLPKDMGPLPASVEEEIQRIERDNLLRYDHIKEEDEARRLKKIEECDHKKWIKKCSCCGGILESEAGPALNIKIDEKEKNNK